MADVTFQRDEYAGSLSRWRLVRDVCAGQEAVKARGDIYLPRPNPSDKSKDNVLRFENYLARAVFYNATQRTLQSLVGVAFRKVPAIERPDALEYIEDDVDGSGVSIYQQSQSALEEVFQTGRAGLLVDYPAVEGSVSRAQMAQGSIRATVTLYAATAVTNWRTDKMGGKHKLSLLVLAESAEEASNDGFGLEVIPQFRVLRLIEGIYSYEIWRKGQESGIWAIAQGPFFPKDGNGAPWNEIPFAFIGSANNDPGVDYSPLHDLAVINLAHYRNSADYEDSAYFVGQAQPWMSGLTEEWRNWMQEQGVYIGSRSPILLPEGGAFGIAQAAPNTLAKEAMDQKERQMIALGARLIEKGSATKTATEAQSDSEAEHSVLSLCASNVSEAYTKALIWMARFMRAPETAAYTLSQDYTEQKLDPQHLTALVAAWQSGAFAKRDLRDILRARGVVNPERTDEEIDDELSEEAGGINLDDGTAIS
jgi:hypothetical protein